MDDKPPILDYETPKRRKALRTWPRVIAVILTVLAGFCLSVPFLVPASSDDVAHALNGFGGLFTFLPLFSGCSLWTHRHLDKLTNYTLLL